MRPQGFPQWPIAIPEVTEVLGRMASENSWGKFVGDHGPNLMEELSEFYECTAAILCSSGTAAVELALRGLNVQPDDEVILAGYDFKGNFQNVLMLGAVPVLVDVSPENWNLDPQHLEEAITEKTKAIIVSHLHGGVVPMAPVLDAAQELGLPVVEDACQMPGSWLAGRRAGTWGDVGILSFGGNKLLSAGRGGAVISRRSDIIQRIRRYTQRGNGAYPMSELQAAVLRPQLSRLDELNARRTAGAAKLLARLGEIACLQPFRNATPDSAPQNWPATNEPREFAPGYGKLGMTFDETQSGGLSRERFARAMRAEGIAIDAGYRSLQTLHGGCRFRTVGDLPLATRAGKEILMLDHPVLLEEDSALEEIITAAKKILRHADELAAT